MVVDEPHLRVQVERGWVGALDLQVQRGLLSLVRVGRQGAQDRASRAAAAVLG